MYQLFSGLVRLGAQLNVVPDVASSWQVQDGGRKYRFHLRDNVCWSDGVPVTAGDFEYAWKRSLNPAGGAPLAHLLYDIRGAKSYHQGALEDPDVVGVYARDELTLEVELEGPVSYFLQLLTNYIAFPQPRHMLQAHGTAWTQLDRIVTNGPFRIAAWEPGESTILERNPAYHGLFGGNLERFEVTIVSGGASKWLQMYADDQLDAFGFGLLPMEKWDRVRQQYARDYLSVSQLTTSYIGFDTSRPPFDDHRVRRSFALATDRESLANITLRGYADPATGGLVPPGMPGHSPGIATPYNPGQARQLLAEAGYPGGQNFPAVAALSGQGYWAATRNECLQVGWRENLGVGIPWIRKELESLIRLPDAAEPRVCIRGWAADYPDPDSFLRASLWEVLTGWGDPAYDELVDDARRVVDRKERMRMYREAETILVEETPILPLVHGRVHLLVKPWVRLPRIPPMGALSYEDIVIKPH